jgi:four helix bundle protein
MSDLKDFEDMKVWQDAQALACEVYKDFSFKDQITRAAVSISNNIAEGAEQSTSTEFSRFLDIAKGSTGEVRSMYRLAQRLNLLPLETVEHRSALCVEISKQLAGFAKYLRAK